MDPIKQKLSELTGKKNIYITQRGNVSIKESLKFAKSLGFDKVFMQDQGGWITYDQFAEKLKLNIQTIKTDYGLVKGTFENCILLINTMPGYGYLQDTEDIKTKKSIVINDASGSIGHAQAKWGDIILGSFGDDKPVNLGKGGFIATNYKMNIDEEKLDEDEKKKLLTLLKDLHLRQDHLSHTQKLIKNDLRKFDIVHPNKEGINVIIKTKNDKEKQEIIDYCEKHKHQYTECPREIRINEPGISIEVKRVLDERRNNNYQRDERPLKNRR